MMKQIIIILTLLSILIITGCVSEAQLKEVDQISYARGVNKGIEMCEADYKPMLDNTIPEKDCILIAWDEYTRQSVCKGTTAYDTVIKAKGVNEVIPDIDTISLKLENGIFYFHRDKINTTKSGSLSYSYVTHINNSVINRDGIFNINATFRNNEAVIEITDYNIKETEFNVEKVRK